MYVEDGLTQQEVAEKLGCREITVRRNMQRHGIKARCTGMTRKAKQAAE